MLTKLRGTLWISRGDHAWAKAALVFKFNGEVTGSYSDYKRFTTDTTVVPTP